MERPIRFELHRVERELRSRRRSDVDDRRSVREPRQRYSDEDVWRLQDVIALTCAARVAEIMHWSGLYHGSPSAETPELSEEPLRYLQPEPLPQDGGSGRPDSEGRA